MRVTAWSGATIQTDEVPWACVPFWQTRFLFETHSPGAIFREVKP